MAGKSALGGDPSTSGEFLVFLLFAATSFGVSLAVNAWIFYRVTGGLFNPAVSIRPRSSWIRELIAGRSRQHLYLLV